jgi:hypothetical protein
MLTLAWSSRSGSVTNRALWPWAPGRTWLWRGQTSPPDGSKDNRTNVSCCRQYLMKPSPSRRKFFWLWPWCDAHWKIGFRGKYYKRVHLGTGYIARVRWICILRAPNAATGKGRGTTVESRESRTSSLLVAKDHVTPAQCEGIMMARLERISTVLSRHNIKSVGLPPKKVSSFFRPVKDNLEIRTPGVYRITCECGKVYTGQTGRSVDTRLKEHQVAHTSWTSRQVSHSWTQRRLGAPHSILQNLHPRH